MNQTKEKEWIDEQGHKVPAIHVGKHLKLAEQGAAKLLKEAIFISKRMNAYKLLIDEISNSVIEATAKSFKGRKPTEKGNYTWFNFDRSVKIEVSISDRIVFDDILIQMCKEKLFAYIDKTLTSNEIFIKSIVQNAFATSKGKLDANKVINLTRYRKDIEHEDFQEALNLLESSIRRPSSTKYFKIYERNADGSYQFINLNFSSI